MKNHNVSILFYFVFKLNPQNVKNENSFEKCFFFFPIKQILNLLFCPFSWNLKCNKKKIYTQLPGVFLLTAPLPLYLMDSRLIPDAWGVSKKDKCRGRLSTFFVLLILCTRGIPILNLVLSYSSQIDVRKST